MTGASVTFGGTAAGQLLDVRGDGCNRRTRVEITEPGAVRELILRYTVIGES
jgi:hypothetical protein